MAGMELRSIFKGLDKSVAYAMASGAVLAVSGSTVAICSTAMGSTNWSSVVAACCGAGLYIQSCATAKCCVKMKEKMDYNVLNQCRRVIKPIKNLMRALFLENSTTQLQKMDLTAFRTLLKESAVKIESALSESCFWNEIENYSKPLTKEKQYFAKMDEELYCSLKDLLKSDHKIEGGSLIIEETDLFEKISELLNAHEIKVLRGLETLEQEYKENAELVVYLHNNEPNVDTNKDSPIREIFPGDNRDAFYLENPKALQARVPDLGAEAPAFQRSQMYPDSPSRHRDTYYPPIKPRSTPKKTPKKSPRHSVDAPKKSPQNSPKRPTPKQSPRRCNID